MHIQYLEQLRQVIGLRSFGQRDRLWLNIKKEAFILFENLLNKLKSDIITLLINMKVVDSSDRSKDNFKQKQNDNFEQLSSKKLVEMNLVLVTQVKNISIVMDLYNKIIINDKNNIIALTK